MAYAYEVDQDQALQVWGWLQSRNGLLIWPNHLAGDGIASYTTPALDENGQPYGRPNWRVAEQPSRHITDPAEVGVYKTKVVKRFHVGTRMGAQGLSIKVTDAGSRRIKNEVAKASEQHKTEAWYAFDYESYENALICVQDGLIPIADFINGMQAPACQDS